MKKVYKRLLVILLALSMVFLASCNSSETSSNIEETKDAKEEYNYADKNKVDVNVSSDSLYVKKVENLTDDFILGMDLSSVISLENAGVKFYDYDGKESDIFTTLAKSGVNYIRVRVWNDPFDKNGNGYGGGNNDIETCVKIGKRATENGMKLLVDFHYSDFWADPAKQMVPKAWKNLEIDDKCAALYEYTKSCLQRLKDEKIDVGMVQIGNETNGSFCGEKVWFNIAKLFIEGCRATREVLPNALIALHFANPEKVTNYQDYSKKLNYYNIDYDVFASSYYPFWHGTLDNLATVLSDIAVKYDKKVMVAETSYAFTDEDSDFNGNTISSSSGITKDYPFSIYGQANLVRNVVDTIVNKTKNGIGVFYWEGAWISAGGSSWEENSALWEKYGCGWASSYASEYDPNDAGKYYGGSAVDNQAFFDSTGKPLESLKVFGLMKDGNIVETKPDAIEDVNIICDLNGKLVLPDKVNAVMTDNSKKEIDVVWDITEEDYEKMYNGGVNKYTVTGKANGMTAICYISMIEFNFLDNYSFEEGETSWEVIKIKNSDELYVEDKTTDSLTGSKHYHFWSANQDSVEFYLEQKVENLLSGRYKYSISIMGGDAGECDVYGYVKINGNIEYKSQKMNITKYLEWDTGTIDSFDYHEGDEISVGIYVKCKGEGNGAWGKIDDALLNSVAE